MDRKAGHPLLRRLGHRRAPSWQAGVAIRRDMANGTHLIFDWRPTLEEAARRLHADQEFWREAPIRPVTWSLVETSRRDAALHHKRRECRAPDCPVAIAETAVTWGVLA
jgi:hypothetical protein